MNNALPMVPVGRSYHSFMFTSFLQGWFTTNGFVGGSKLICNASFQTSTEENQKKKRCDTQLVNEQVLAPPKKKRRGFRRNSQRNKTSDADNLESSGSVNEGLDCSEEILEEDEGECSVPNCLQPMADQISWVQCNQCQ